MQGVAPCTSIGVAQVLTNSTGVPYLFRPIPSPSAGPCAAWGRPDLRSLAVDASRVGRPSAKEASGREDRSSLPLPRAPEKARRRSPGSQANSGMQPLEPGGKRIDRVEGPGRTLEEWDLSSKVGPPSRGNMRLLTVRFVDAGLSTASQDRNAARQPCDSAMPSFGHSRTRLEVDKRCR